MSPRTRGAHERKTSATPKWNRASSVVLLVIAGVGDCVEGAIAGLPTLVTAAETVTRFLRRLAETEIGRRVSSA